MFQTRLGLFKCDYFGFANPLRLLTIAGGTMRDTRSFDVAASKRGGEVGRQLQSNKFDISLYDLEILPCTRICSQTDRL